MRILSRTEEMLLLAVRALEPLAYGLSIGEFLKEHSGRAWSVGAIYIPLERLRKRGLLSALDGDPTPERGGRSKRFYRLTSKGLEALGEVKRLHDLLWAAADR
ncbi:MAG: PadR family transcriptional regulator [Anaerolineales bacterium]